MNPKRWTYILAAFMVGIAVLMQVPQLLHVIHPSYEGVLVHLNSDEHDYLSRTQQALMGTLSETAESYTGDGIEGLQSTLIERVYGVLLGWTELNAGGVLQIMDSVIPALLFLVLWLLFVVSGFSKKQSLIGAIFFFVTLLYLLNRPVQQRGGLLLGLTAMLGIVHGVRGKTYVGILSALLMGQLVGVYFWSWTYAWAWCGIFGVGVLLWGHKNEKYRLIQYALLCLLSASPYIFSMMMNTGDPLFAVAKFRTGIPVSRLPESVFYSVCFTLMLAGVGGSMLKHKNLTTQYSLVLVTALTSFIVLHQQVIHAQVLRFVSHYLFFLVVSAVATLLYSALVARTRNRSWWLALSFIGSSAYLLANVYDGGGSLMKQFSPSDSRFSEQHLADSLPVLDALPRSTILADTKTSLFLSANTHHDVLFATYLANTLMTHEELAERRCLVFAMQGDVSLEDERHLLYPGAVRSLKSDAIREREVELTRSTCEKIQKDIDAYLQTYNIEYLLWDKVRSPNWNKELLKKDVSLVEENDDWGLWKLTL